MLKRFISIFVILFLAGCSLETISQSEINSVPTSIDDQRNIILKFEKQLVCDYHSPCFDSVVDGALQNDPQNAINQCQAAMYNIDKLVVPSGLPLKVTELLDQTRQILKNDSQNELSNAQKFASSTFNTVGEASGECSTCSAFHNIQVINRRYDIDKMMQGQYVNCEVLKSMYGQ